MAAPRTTLYIPDESESSAFPREPVTRNVNVSNLATSLEHSSQVFRRRPIREVVDFQRHHAFDPRRRPAVAHRESSGCPCAWRSNPIQQRVCESRSLHNTRTNETRNERAWRTTGSKKNKTTCNDQRVALVRTSRRRKWRTFESRQRWPMSHTENVNNIASFRTVWPTVVYRPAARPDWRPGTLRRRRPPRRGNVTVFENDIFITYNVLVISSRWIAI